jgi:TonB family protein
MPLPVSCQRSGLQDEINSAYKGKTLLLRNFYSGAVLEYDETGTLPGGVPGPWTLASIEISRVGVTSQGIEIVGNRMGMWYRDGKRSLVKVGRLKIHVAVHVSDAGGLAALHRIFNKIFIEPGEDLRSMVPEYWKYYLEGSDYKSRFAAWRASWGENVIQAPKSGDAPVGRVTAPSVGYSPDPKYSKEAASHHIEGVSALGVLVGTTGTASNIAILEPLGMGLDEQAVLAIEGWKFRPGMKDGEPVRVQIRIEMDFRCCP